MVLSVLFSAASASVLTPGVDPRLDSSWYRMSSITPRLTRKSRKIVPTSELKVSRGRYPTRAPTTGSVEGGSPVIEPWPKLLLASPTVFPLLTPSLKLDDRSPSTKDRVSSGSNATGHKAAIFSEVVFLESNAVNHTGQSGSTGMEGFRVATSLSTCVASVASLVPSVIRSIV